MKTKTALVALLVLPCFTAFVHGQNLFRTGRPAYARVPATYHDRYINSNMNRSERGNYVPRDAGYVEQERLQRAWDDYRREATRYNTRYGSAGASSYGSSSFDRPSPIAPVGYNADFIPCGRCNSLPIRDYDRLPATERPASSYRNTNYYGARNDFSSNTVTRPFTSLLDSLFGASR